MKKINIEKILLQAFSDENFKQFNYYKSYVLAEKKLEELEKSLNGKQKKILNEYLDLETQYIGDYNIDYGKYIFAFLKSFFKD